MFLDPWMDNALESLYSTLRHQSPDILEVELQGHSLTLRIKDERRFLKTLQDMVGQRSGNLNYEAPRKAGGTFERIKDCIIFATQPPQYRPRIYRGGDKLSSLLKDAFLKEREKPKESTCPLCGEPFPKEKLLQGVYPLSTKTLALSGRIRFEDGKCKGTGDYNKCCSRCYFLGAFEWTDEAYLYRTSIGRRRKRPQEQQKLFSVVCLPYVPDLRQLHELKEGIRRIGLDTKAGFSNVKVQTARPADENPPALYSLLLSFLEKVLWGFVSEKEEASSLSFEEVKRHIPRGWTILRVPQGKMKDIDFHGLSLEDELILRLKTWVERGICAYRDIINHFGLHTPEGKQVKDIYEMIREMKEEMAEALLLNRMELFARHFTPRPRVFLDFPWQKGFEEKLIEFIKIWRWDMKEELFETVRKGGRTLAILAAQKKQPVIFYALERTRTPSDMLDFLTGISHRVASLGEEEWQENWEKENLKYISIDSLEKITEALQAMDEAEFRDLKNTLVIFSGFDYARKKMEEVRKRKGGKK